MKVRNQILANQWNIVAGFFACTRHLYRQTSHFDPLYSSFILFLYKLDWICLFILVKMGLLMSLPVKGLPTAQVIGKVTERFYEMFQEKNIHDLEGFHLAILEMFVTVNAAMPGKHWLVPPLHEIKECFERVKDEADEEDKKKVVLEFMKEKIQPNRADNSLLIIGLATPPVAMAAKKTGESVPQLKFIKSVPDVLFVPAATLLALVSVKLSRRLYLQNDNTI